MSEQTNQQPVDSYSSYEEELPDFRQKGLGWIPDYPDIRDYNLDGDDVVRQNDTLNRSDNIELLADILKVLIAKEPQCEVDSKLHKNLLDNLDRKVFGDIRFCPVTVQKILQKGSPNCKEIRELKWVLHLLNAANGCLQNSLPIPFQDDLNKQWDWLLGDEFDDETYELIKGLQEKMNLDQTGIVNLETYTAIAKYLREPGSLPEIRQQQLSLQLLSVPSPMPEPVLEEIFSQLKTAFSGLENILAYPSFRDIFYEQFSIIEPLVSIALEMVCPLAQYDSMEDAIATIKHGMTCALETLDSENGRQLHKAFKKIKSEIDRYTIGKSYHELSQLKKLLDFFLKQDRVSLLASLVNQNGSKDLENIHFDKKHLFEIQDPAGNSSEEKSLTPSDNSPSLVDHSPHSTSPAIQASISPKGSYPPPESIRAEQNATFFMPQVVHLPINRSFRQQGEDENAAKLYFYLPSVVDLSLWCSPIENQGQLNACSAHAGVGLVEYFARKQLDRRVDDLSPLFLYKVSRRLRHRTGDVGASIRDTMQAMVAFGIPPEEYWPYDEENCDLEPPAFCYAFAQNYQTVRYFRLDRADISKDMLLFRIQAVLAAGFPCMFGFTIYSSAYRLSNIKQGHIPFPDKRQDNRVGGHAVLAVGYDDHKVIEHANHKEESSKGALLIRNSWGPKWGQVGYGWLPYDYILNGLTADWWSLLKAEWFETGQFGMGAKISDIGGHLRRGHKHSN
jgi:C1A family cysteine protease